MDHESQVWGKCVYGLSAKPYECWERVKIGFLVETPGCDFVEEPAAQMSWCQSRRLAGDQKGYPKSSKFQILLPMFGTFQYRGLI